jgi:hypothetical protein
MEQTIKTTFEKLSAINVNDRVEKKNGLTYLSWAWAWSEVKKACPDATYKIKETDYDEQLGFMCHTEVSIDGETLEMWLPVMDGANKSMKKEAYTYTTRYGEKSVDAATSFDINKTLMRCLVKNLAMFGLGIYIFAGEDLPESESAATVVERPVFPPVLPDLIPLAIDDENWTKVLNYVVSNKDMGTVKLLRALSAKYEISTEAKAAITKVVGKK